LSLPGIESRSSSLQSDTILTELPQLLFSCIRILNACTGLKILFPVSSYYSSSCRFTMPPVCTVPFYTVLPAQSTCVYFIRDLYLGPGFDPNRCNSEKVSVSRQPVTCRLELNQIPKRRVYQTQTRGACTTWFSYNQWINR
jgi:hypothetical protein